MSMDLSQYQKVKADEKFSVLRHRNGSEFKIAHEGLSPEIASRIHKMPMFAAGGVPSVGQLATDVADPSAALSGATLGIKNPLTTSIENTASGINGKSLGVGQQAPEAAMASGVQTPATAAGVQAAQGSAVNQAGQLSNVAAQTNGQNGSANLGAALNNSNQFGGQLANVGGMAAQTQAIGQQGALNGQLANAGGVQNQQAGAAGIQSAANQLQGVANGTGPNPAQAMLNQQTGANVANQAALMAGQRGASANAGLIAREAAQQGAATQQQAVGQGATMQAQQQLSALGQLTGANQALAGVGAGQVGQAQTGIANQGAMGATATGQQQAQLAQQAGIAQNQVQNQIGANTAATQAAQSQQQIQQGALTAQNTNLAGQQANINTVGGAQNVAGIQGSQGLSGGLLNGAGSALGSLAARGGEVAYEGGGQINPGTAQTPQVDPGTAQTPDPTQPQSSFFGFLKNWTNQNDDDKSSGPVQTGAPNSGPQQLNNGVSSAVGGLGKLAAVAAMAARGGKVKGLVSEGEVVVPPQDAKSPERAARDVAAAKATGGQIKAATPDQKAVKKGNSYANDKIEKDLPVGGIVIPRSVMQSKDPVRGAGEFVRAVMKKKGSK